ncbi:ABC transporter permease [Paenochrobactrum pullorum]|uniref:ABC transporter permease n=1 Tax=Paenochrobactrum pullorum TaxID=1324351 RepID=UPI0035BC2126
MKYISSNLERRFATLSFKTEWVILALLTLLIASLSIAPVARLAMTALMPEGQFSLSWVYSVLAKKQIFTATLNTLYISVFSTLLALLIGSAAGFLTIFTKMRWKQAWIFAFVLPLMIPPQVTALAWVQALSPTSPLLSYLPFTLSGGTKHPLYSSTGIIILLGLYNAPLVYLTLRATLRRIPADLMEAARASGAKPWVTMLSVVLPLSRTGLLAGAALAFVSAIGNFGIQAMLGIPARFPTLITIIYQRLNSYGPTALSEMAVIALFLTIIASLCLILNSWLANRSDVRVSGLGQNMVWDLGKWKYPVEIIAWGFHLITLVLPISALIASSLVRGVGQELNFNNLTFENYRQALFAQEAIRNAFITSFNLTLASSAVIMVLSLFLAYFLSWQKGLLSRILQVASELTYALPGIILGVAMILFFLKPIPILNISIYGSVWIIFVAYISNFLALCLRPALSGFAQVDRSMDEAARVAGAGFLTRMRTIIAPLVAPALVAGGILVFMSALNEIQVSILLVSSSTRTIGPMIVFLEEGGSSALAAAVGCLIVMIIFLLMAFISLFSHKLPKGALPWQN